MPLAAALPTFERFEVLERIGVGAFADVYKAHDRKNARIVALKVISPHLTTDPVSLERFRREVQITRHIGHPSIVPIFEVYEAHDRPVLVMEYVEGEELKRFIDTRSPIPFDVVRSILQQLLEALQSCHEKNVIHRDLKPQNVLVTEDHRIRILDFGVAKMMQLTDLTKSGTTLGTPEYAAPEVYSSSLYDPRSDLYSIGVISFQLVSGQLPFQANSVAELFHRQLNAELPSLSGLRVDTPVWLERFISRLLARQPFERYQSCKEALNDLRQQQVVADSTFELPQRKCLSCHLESPEALSICLHCGYDLSSPDGSAAYDLVYPKASSPEGLREFAQERFKRQIVPPDRTRVLIGGLSEEQATILRDQATESGLLLRIRRLHPCRLFFSTFLPALLGSYLIAWGICGYLTLLSLAWFVGPAGLTGAWPIVVNTSAFLLLGTRLSTLALSLVAENSAQTDSTMRLWVRKTIERSSDLPGLRSLLKLPAAAYFAVLAGSIFALNLMAYLTVLQPPHEGSTFLVATVVLLLDECLVITCGGLYIFVNCPRLRERLYHLAERRRLMLRRWCGPLLDRMSATITVLFVVLVPTVFTIIGFSLHQLVGLFVAEVMYPLVLVSVLAHRAFRSLDSPLLPAMTIGSTRLRRLSKGLQPYVRAECSPEFRAVLVAIVQKILAIDRVLEGEPASRDLENVARLAARVTHKASKLRQLAPDRDVQHALTAFQHLAHKISRSDDSQLLESQRAIQARLKEYMKIEEGLSRLYLQMIRLNASLDRLALMELRTNPEVNDTLCGNLTVLLEGMESEIQLFLEARSELERAG